MREEQQGGQIQGRRGGWTQGLRHSSKYFLGERLNLSTEGSKSTLTPGDEARGAPRHGLFVGTEKA